MKAHAPPPLDAPEAVWRAYIADQIAHLHECFEAKQEATDERVEVYHIQNQRARDEDRKVVLAAIEELKQEAQASSMWISAEKRERESAADVEKGRQMERARWLGWLDQLKVMVNDVWQWAGKPALGAAAVYVAYQVF